MTDAAASPVQAAELPLACGEVSVALAGYRNRCRRLHDRAAAALASAKTGQLMVVIPGVDPVSASDLSLLRRVISEMAELLPPDDAGLSGNGR